MTVNGWLDFIDVRQWLGLYEYDPMQENVLQMSINAAESSVSSWRLADTPDDWSVCKQTHPHVYAAACRLAGLTYQQNVTPEGFAGFEDSGGIVFPNSSLMVNIRHQARANSPAVG